MESTEAGQELQDERLEKCIEHGLDLPFVMYRGNCKKEIFKCSAYFVAITLLLLGLVIKMSSFGFGIMLFLLFWGLAVRNLKLYKAIACLYNCFFPLFITLLKDGFIVKVGKKEQFVAWDDVVDVNYSGYFISVVYKLREQNYSLRFAGSSKYYGLLVLLLLIAYYNSKLAPKIKEILKSQRFIIFLKNHKQGAAKLEEIIKNEEKLKQFIVEENKFESYPSLEESLYCRCKGSSPIIHAPEVDTQRCISEQKEILLKPKKLYPFTSYLLFGIYILFLFVISMLVAAFWAI